MDVADECVEMVEGAHHLRALLVFMEMPPKMVIEGGWSPVTIPHGAFDLILPSYDLI